MKILHAADLHIDSPLRGLSLYEGAPEEDLRLATRRALENLVRLAIELPADAVLLAGDVYDGDWKDYQTGLYFSRQMARLGRAGIPVYMVSGNHDAQNRTMRSLRLPDNVHVFATREPETVRDEKAGLVVHGQGFAEWDLTDNLAAGYPPRDGGLFNVGLLHTGLEGGHHEHKRYAPCTIADLEARDYDYWALGHVHTQQIVRRQPWIVYPGNIQGRHAREPGPKGCIVVTVDGDLRVQSVDHHDLDSTARWARLDVDVTGLDDTDQVLSRVQQRFQEIPEERLTAVRVTLKGRTSAHAALWRHREQMLNELRAAAGHHPNLWLEKVKVRTSSEDGGRCPPGWRTSPPRRMTTVDPLDSERLRPPMPNTRRRRSPVPGAVLAACMAGAAACRPHLTGQRLGGGEVGAGGDGHLQARGDLPWVIAPTRPMWAGGSYPWRKMAPSDEDSSAGRSWPTPHRLVVPGTRARPST